MTMEWGDLKVLLAVGRTGSVAAAARSLRVDSSTISRRLAALELALGATVLIRGKRELFFTPEGRIALEASEAMDAAAEAAQRSLRASKLDLAGSVRVSVAPALVRVLLRQMLPALRLQQPALSVELLGSFECVDLARGDADIAVRMVRPEDPDLVVRRAFECDWFVYASPSYLEARGHPQRFDDLSQHELLLYGETLLRAPATRWLDAYRSHTQSATRVDSVESACLTALADGGVAVLPAFIADPLVGLMRVFPVSVAANTGFIVFHDALRDTCRVRVVADALFNYFQEQAPMFAGANQGSAGRPHARRRDAHHAGT